MFAARLFRASLPVAGRLGLSFLASEAVSHANLKQNFVYLKD